MLQKSLKLLFLIFSLLMSSCSEKPIVIRTVLIPVCESNGILSTQRLDSIVWEYTNISSSIERVKRIIYDKSLAEPYIINYILINKVSKSDIGIMLTLYNDTLYSPYLDVAKVDTVWRCFNFISKPKSTTLSPPINFYTEGWFVYKYKTKDLANNISFYVFQGNDLGFNNSSNNVLYYYFDERFHLRKITDSKSKILFVDPVLLR